MGSSFWQTYTTYSEDVDEALTRAQREVYERGASMCMEPPAPEEARTYYRREANMQQQLYEQFGRESNRIAYEAALEMLGEFSPPDDEPFEQTRRRLIARQDTEGTHSVLDMERVGDEDAFGVLRRVPAEELEEVLFTTTPTREEIEARGESLLHGMDRWKGVAIVVHDEEGTPTHWLFAGHSGD